MRLTAVGADAVWLPTDVEEGEVEALLENDNYCAQTKEDGVHVLAARKAERVVALNRRGEVHAIPKPLEAMLSQLAPDTMIDGEKLHEGGMVAFDLLYDSGEDLRIKSYGERLARLAELCLEVNSPLLRPVETALTTAAKRALVERLRAANAEGVILKDLRSQYTPGRTAWGWSMRRLKFRKSLTAVVMRRTGDTKASFELFLFDPTGEPVNIGSVSAQQFYDHLQPGQTAIAEVTYLYGTPSQRIVQPVLKRPQPFRDDKRPEDCRLTQIVQGGRFAAPRV